MYGLISKINAVPGQRDALAAILLKVTTPMPGCLSFVIAADPADDNALWITEVWDGQASHQASLSLPAVQAAIAKARPMIVGFGSRVETNPMGGRGIRAKDEEAQSLESISPFFIVKDLQVSVSHYIERFGFQLAFQGPKDDPYYAGVSRDGIGIMLKAILPEVLPQPNHTRHEWARWDAYMYTQDPDTLFEEFSQRGASFVKTLSFIDDGLWGFEVTDADGYVLAFFCLRD